MQFFNIIVRNRLLQEIRPNFYNCRYKLFAMFGTVKNHAFISNIDFSNLPQGFIVDKTYRILRSLQKGSGGTVYLVEVVKEEGKDGDLQNLPKSTAPSSQISKSNQSNEEPNSGIFLSHAKEEKKFVLKIYSNKQEMEFFWKES